VYAGYIYLANHNGVLRCFDFKTGSKMYEERLGQDCSMFRVIGGGDGKIYCPVEQGVVHVIKAGPKMEVLAKNELGEPCLANAGDFTGCALLSHFSESYCGRVKPLNCTWHLSHGREEYDEPVYALGFVLAFVLTTGRPIETVRRSALHKSPL